MILISGQDDYKFFVLGLDLFWEGLVLYWVDENLRECDEQLFPTMDSNTLLLAY